MSNLIRNFRSGRLGFNDRQSRKLHPSTKLPLTSPQHDRTVCANRPRACVKTSTASGDRPESRFILCEKCSNNSIVLASSAGVSHGRALNNKFSSQSVIVSLRVTFDSLQPSRASSSKMTSTKNYPALPLKK